MADSVTQPDSNATSEAGETINKLDEQNTEKTLEPSTAVGISATPSTVIWTPRFIVIFALALILGLSAESLLTQGWESHYYAAVWVLLAHAALVFACLLALIRVTRSRWIRVGSIFGCIWAIFTSINLLVSFYRLDTISSSIPAYLNAIICSALLGAYICLSIEHTPFRAWDTWFFRLALIIGICGAPIAYFIKPAVDRSVSTIESAIAAIELVFCILVWWLRPSCWKTSPGPAFLYGFTPTIILLLSIPSLGTGSTNLFLSQVAFLCFILGTMRMMQSELKRTHRSSH